MDLLKQIKPFFYQKIGEVQLRSEKEFAVAIAEKISNGCRSSLSIKKI